MLPTIPKEPSFTIIDQSDAIATIRQKFGDACFIAPEALWEAAALWGVTPETRSINDCGVFTYITDSFCFIASGYGCEAQLVQAPNGHWAMSTSYHTRISGGGYACSVWSRTAFPTRDDARLAAIHELIAHFQSEAASPNSCNSEANQREAQSMINLLEAEKMPQLSLF